MLASVQKCLWRWSFYRKWDFFFLCYQQIAIDRFFSASKFQLFFICTLSSPAEKMHLFHDLKAFLAFDKECQEQIYSSTLIRCNYATIFFRFASTRTCSFFFGILCIHVSTYAKSRFFFSFIRPLNYTYNSVMQILRYLQFFVDVEHLCW